MDKTTASTDRVQINSIVQVAPSVDQFPGALGAVIDKHSWGCNVNLNGQSHAIAWQHMEPTGGMLVFDADGKPLRNLATPLSHHP